MERRQSYFSTKVQFWLKHMIEFLKVIPIKVTPFINNFKFPRKKILKMLLMSLTVMCEKSYIRKATIFLNDSFQKFSNSLYLQWHLLSLDNFWIKVPSQHADVAGRLKNVIILLLMTSYIGLKLKSRRPVFKTSSRRLAGDITQDLLKTS